MRIFIGSGSNDNIRDDYLKMTKNVCDMLCNLDYSLVFGAYSKGMMGVCYNTFISNNKKVLGVTLKEYADDLNNLKGMDYVIVDNSFKRLEYIYNESDIFLILPGGTGSLGELFGLMEENKTNKLDKKIIVYNYKGFYNELIDYIKKLKIKGFTYQDELDKLIIVDNIKILERVVKDERN